MKKFTLIAVFIGILIPVHSQITLDYEKHALMANEVNPMVLTNYTDPGENGANAYWDFSTLSVIKDFTGYVDFASDSEFSLDFPESNVDLKEFNNHFFFNLNQNQIEQYGLVTANGEVKVKYTKPFVKMKYPFTYGNSFSGNFEGKYLFNDKEWDVTGQYEVSGDAYGTLVLPGYTADDVLRVKEVKNYTRSKTDITITTYRWYAENIRFPLLVLTEVKTGECVSHQAAYREKADFKLKQGSQKLVDIPAKEFIKVYPNPFSDEITVNLNLKSGKNDIKVRVIDPSGRNVFSKHLNHSMAGMYTLDLQNEFEKLSRGSYILNIQINDNTYKRSIIKTE